MIEVLECPACSLWRPVKAFESVKRPTGIFVRLRQPQGYAREFQELGSVSAFDNQVKYGPLLKGIARVAVGLVDLLEPHGYVRFADSEARERSPTLEELAEQDVSFYDPEA